MFYDITKTIGYYLDLLKAFCYECSVWSFICTFFIKAFKESTSHDQIKNAINKSVCVKKKCFTINLSIFKPNGVKDVLLSCMLMSLIGLDQTIISFSHRDLRKIEPGLWYDLKDMIYAGTNTDKMNIYAQNALLCRCVFLAYG